MLWKKDKSSSYLNNWYDISLNSLASKIPQAVKEDRTYSNIPFGRSLIDIHSDGQSALVNIKTVVNGKLNVREIHTSLPYVFANLHSSRVYQNWENSDDIALTTEKLKQICIAMAELIHYSNNKNDVWVFPYFDYFIAVEIDETYKKSGKKYSSGSASIRSFDGAYGSGGTISGTFFEKDESINDTMKTLGLDFSLFSTLCHSKLDDTFWNGKRYAAINADNEFPIGETVFDQR